MLSPSVVLHDHNELLFKGPMAHLGSFELKSSSQSKLIWVFHQLAISCQCSNQLANQPQINFKLPTVNIVRSD